MHFDLTDDQKMLRDQLDSLFADRLNDVALMRLYDREDTFDSELWSALMEMGLGGVLVSEVNGGLGMGLLTLAVIAESFGRAAAPAPVVANALAAWLLSEAGGHQATVDALISGEKVAAFAFAAPTGWAPDDWVLDGATLTGTVGSVEWGTRADLFVVGLAGGHIGLVERSAAGLTIEVAETVDRTRPVGGLTFKDVAVHGLPVDRTLVDRLINALAVVYAAGANGAARKVLDLTISYANMRTQFGKLIGQFQGLKYQIVNQAIEVEPCRPLVWYAAHAWDAIPSDSARAAAIAKAHVTEVAVRTGRAAVEAHGGIGYTWEYPLHVWLKRAMHDRAMHGAPAVHLERSADLGKW